MKRANVSVGDLLLEGKRYLTIVTRIVPIEAGEREICVASIDELREAGFYYDRDFARAIVAVASRLEKG